MNYLVIGGAGFIGSALCEALILRGDSVVCADNLSRGRREFADECARLSKRTRGAGSFVFAQGDATDPRFLDELIGKYGVYGIFQLAANSDIRSGSIQTEAVSTMATTVQTLAAAERNGVRNVFLASSSAVYGRGVDVLLNESSEIDPVSYYGAAKASSEAWCCAFARMSNASVVILRFPNVVGPRMTHGVIKDFVDRLRGGPKDELEVLGDGSQTKSYIWVGDLVSAILVSCDEMFGGPGPDWVGSCARWVVKAPDDLVSVSDIAGRVVRALGVPDAEIRYGSGNVGWNGDVPTFEYSDSSFRFSFGKKWRPAMTGTGAVDAAIRAYVEETGGRIK
jgi:UDP-glucose 4-epimerase